jgi:hypothetical protein
MLTKSSRTSAVVLVLAVLIITSCQQESLANIQNDKNTPVGNFSIQLSYGGLSLREHKIASQELSAYQNSAGIYQEDTDYNLIVGGHGTGLSPPTSSQWIDIAQNGFVVDSISAQTTPTVVDLSATPWFPPIGDQAQQGSCASFAVGYYSKTYQEAKDHGWNLTGATWTGGDDDGNVSLAYQNHVMSPAFIYNLINGGEDVGSDFETPIKLVCNVGICSWQNMPYYWQDCQRWPTQAAWSEAPLYRSDSTYNYQYLYVNTTTGISSLKNWLAAGNLAIVAIDAVDNLWNYSTHRIALNSQDLIDADYYTVGNLDHAATIVGYNDTITYMENGSLHSGAFKIANSWGKASWENVPDGCYWVSYEAMMKMGSTPDNPVVLFQDLNNYQPQLLAKFNINHDYPGDCKITFGLGTPSATVATKNFPDYIYGGKIPFCENNIVFDLTELKSSMTGMYNQRFFMQVYDAALDAGGNKSTGTINYFALGNTTATGTPLQTQNGQTVNLTLTLSFTEPTFAATPNSGAPLSVITLNGVGFAGNSIDLSYLNPITQTWTPIVSNLSLQSENFSYVTYTPDLLQSNPSGDTPALYDLIIYRAKDNSNSQTYNASAVKEWRRGLTSIGNITTTGLFGNNTNLASTVFVINGQQLRVCGRWFSPGNATLLWDNNVSLATATVDANGDLNTTIQVPNSTAGPHTLTVKNGFYTFNVNLTRLPKVTVNYADIWHTNNFSVDITADYGGTETYYRINNGATNNVTTNGQPTITTEGASNSVEYWTTWNVYGTSDRELNHATITGLKLDKTAPSGYMMINGGLTVTQSTTVTVFLSASDSTSGIKQVLFSNDEGCSQTTWEPFTLAKNWQLTNGDGAKKVYCQVQDNADLTTTISSYILLNTQSEPTATTKDTPGLTQQANPLPSPTTTPTPSLPEFNVTIIIALLAALTAFVLLADRHKKAKIFFG